MLPSLDNFIDFGKDVFAARPDYRAMAVDFFTTAMTSDALSGDVDRVNGCKIGEAILLNLRGHVDDVCERINQTLLKKDSLSSHCHIASCRDDRNGCHCIR